MAYAVCRGVIFAAQTNYARTQMAEAIFRHMCGGQLFVTSVGQHHEQLIHPLACEVMEEIGLSLRDQSPKAHSAVPNDRTYDVFVGIDAPKGKPKDDNDMMDSPLDGAMLFPPAPAHWEVVQDSSDVRRKWRLWSPRNPTILHENSWKKFQDEYEGEPLWCDVKSGKSRVNAKLSERWEIETLKRKPLECHSYYRARFCAARDEIQERCRRLLKRMEKHFGVPFHVQDI